MRNLLILTTIILFMSCKETSKKQTNYINTGTKEIELSEIWDGTFSPKRMNALNSMNGDFYSLLNTDDSGNTSVDKYSYKTLEKVETIVNSANLKGLESFSSYSFNNDETKLILGTNFKKIYRHSFKGTFYAYDIASKSLTLIEKDIQEPGRKKSLASKELQFYPK